VSDEFDDPFMDRRQALGQVSIACVDDAAACIVRFAISLLNESESGPSQARINTKDDVSGGNA